MTLDPSTTLVTAVLTCCSTKILNVSLLILLLETLLLFLLTLFNRKTLTPLNVGML